MTAELRPEWVCTGCEMRVYNTCHDAIPAPKGWDRKTDRCLACSKEGETAEDTEDRARRLVLEGGKTNEIARSCKGVKKGWINDLRKELIEAGDLDPSTVQPAAKPERDRDRIKQADEAKVPAVEEALRADPARTNSVLAEELGVNVKTVAVTRKRLGVPDAINAQKQANDARIHEALRAHPDLTDDQIAERLDLGKATVGARRRKLGIPGKKPHSTVGST